MPQRPQHETNKNHGKLHYLTLTLFTVLPSATQWMISESITSIHPYSLLFRVWLLQKGLLQPVKWLSIIFKNRVLAIPLLVNNKICKIISHKQTSSINNFNKVKSTGFSVSIAFNNVFSISIERAGILLSVQKATSLTLTYQFRNWTWEITNTQFIMMGTILKPWRPCSILQLPMFMGKNIYNWIPSAQSLPWK